MGPPIARIYGGSLTSAVALTLVAWGIRALRGAALRRHLPGGGARRAGGPDARLAAALAQSAKRLARAPAPLSAAALRALLELAPFPLIVVDIREEGEAGARPLPLPSGSPIVRVQEDGLLAAFNPQAARGAATGATPSSDASTAGASCSGSSVSGSSASGASRAGGGGSSVGGAGASTSGAPPPESSASGAVGAGQGGREAPHGGILPAPRGTLVVFVSGNSRQARRCAAFTGSLGHLKTAYLSGDLEALQEDGSSVTDPELIGRDAVAALLGLLPGVTPVRKGKGAARAKAAAAISVQPRDYSGESLSGSDSGLDLRLGDREAEVQPPSPSAASASFGSLQKPSSLPRGLLGGGLAISSAAIQQRLGRVSNPVLSGIGGLIGGTRGAPSGDVAAALRRDEPGSERCFVVDVRRHDERTLFGAIPGTLHLPAQQALRAVHLSEEEWERAFRFGRPRPQDTVVLVSRTNQRAVWVAELFRSQGLGRTLVYKQGAYGWHLGEDVKQYASYGEGEAPPDPEDFDVESPAVGAAMAELDRLSLSAFVSPA